MAPTPRPRATELQEANLKRINRNMKNYLLIPAVAITFAACGGGDAGDDNPVPPDKRNGGAG